MQPATLHRPAPATVAAGPHAWDHGGAGFSLTASVTVPPGGAEGLIRAQRGRFDSWALYCHGGRLCFAYDVLGTREFIVVGRTRLAGGVHQARADFLADDEAPAPGGDVTLFLDGAQVGEGHVGAARPPVHAAEESAEGTRATLGSHYAAQTGVFTGTIHWVQLDSASAGRLLTADDRLRVAMTQH